MDENLKKTVWDHYFNKIWSLQQGYFGNPPKNIYHYTNVSAFMGIVLNKALWASRAEFLNDDKEFRYGQEMCETAIRQLISLDRKYEKFGNMLREAFVSSISSPFITCFCQDGDLLSQWRGYSRHGQGLSVAFDPVVLHRIKYVFVHNVLYEPKRQLEFMSNCVRQIADSFLEFKVNLDDPEVLRELVGYTASLDRYCALMKDAAFSEERESRIVIGGFHTRGKLDVLFRERNNLIVPYVNVRVEESWESVIKEVIVGPGPEPDLRAANLRHFLDLQGLSNVVVRASACQFRN
jgi:hypothetical protein